MSFERYIDECLEDVILDRMDSNKDRTAIDHMEHVLLKSMASNRFDNDNFYTVSDTIVKNAEVIEDTLNISLDRNTKATINLVVDILIAEQIRQSGELDKLSDKDYYWVEDQINEPLYKVFYGDGRRRGRDRGRDHGRGDNYERRPQRGFSSRGQSVGYRDSYRYSDNSRNEQPRNRGFNDNQQRPQYSNYRQEDTRRSFGETDGYSMLAKMQNKRNQQEVPRRTVEDESRHRDSYTREVEENVSYEPVDNPRGYTEPSSDYDVEAQKEFERAIMGDDVKRSRDTKCIVLTPPPADKQGYDHTSERPFEEFWEDDRKWQVSVNTKWRLSGVGIETYPQLYNIYKYVSYHVMDKYGYVTQEFKVVNDDNRYINQTLLKDPDNYSKAFGRKPPKLSDILGDTKEVEEKPVEKALELEDVIDIDQEDLTHLNTIKPSENLATSAIEARSKIEDGRNSAVSVFMLMDPIEGTSTREADLIKRLYSETTLASLSKSMCELEQVIAKPIWDKLNKKIGSAILAEVNSTFGLNIVSMNFAKHWTTVVDKLSKDIVKYPPEWIDNFSRKLNAMIPTFLGVIDVLDSDGKINPIFEHIVTKDNINRVVPFVNFYALVSLNCTLDQLSVGRQLELSSPVTIRAGGNFYGAEILHSIMNEISGEKGTPSTKLMLSTKCGSLIEVRKQELNSSTLILTLHDK